MAQIKRYPHYPDYAVPPGTTLKETIQATGMDQKELAIRIGLDKKTVNHIINGSHPLSQQTAIKLERATGVPARIWNNLEMQYQERKARLKDHARLEKELYWMKSIPVKELIDRGVLRQQSDKVALLREVLAFFGVNSATEWKALWMESLTCRFRRSRAFEIKPGATATWIRLGEIEAQTLSCKPYDKSQFMNALHSIKELTKASPEIWQPRMKELCSKAGVAVVFIREIKGCPASGLTRWLTSDKAMIQLSLRYKRDDHFWFTFFHEASHILKDSKKVIILEDGNNDGDSEKQADKFSTEFLIPAKHVGNLSSLKSKRDIMHFADKLGIAPGIVVGQMQKRGLVPYTHFNGLKCKLSWIDQ